MARIEPEKLIDLLDRLPLGISARDAGGGLIYANRLGARLSTSEPADRDVVVDGHTMRRRHLSLPLGGAEPCDVTLTLDVTEQVELENSLFQRAYYDELTGLPNRALLEQTVGTLIETRPQGAFALAFIDLDGFKHINDYYGHAVGDALLLRLAKRMLGEIRETDVLARVGGDEFVLLMPVVGSVDDLGRDTERLLQRLKQPFFIEGHEIFTSASIGVSLYPADGRRYDELCAHADSAMYRVKGGTKGAVSFFDASLARAPSERMKVEQRLRLVVRDRRLCCAYQPKVDFRSGTVTGVEVLLRWRDEDGHVKPPGDFVNLAVELGLMDEITHFVLGETAAAVDHIDDAFGPESSISLNIAARQAGEPRFMQSFLEALESTGLTRRVMLELTEEAFLSRGRFQGEILPMIREAGARVSIDDFGVGYSSLAELADLTVDEIKVDRSFITAIHSRPRSQSVLKAIESLAQALGMSIVVEGVETAEELAYLMAATRIRVGQGYYFAKPMLLDELPLKRSSTERPALAPIRGTAPTRPGAQRAPLINRAG